MSYDFFRIKKKFDEERRCEPRYPVMLEARMGLLTASNKTVRISDLSVGGCYLNTILPAETGAIIQMELILPTGRTFAVSGTVAFCDPHIGIGVKFNLSPQQREFLTDLIEYSRQDS